MIVIKTNINNCAGIILETHFGVKNNNNNVETPKIAEETLIELISCGRFIKA